jgi:hypothetical protein
MYDRQHIYNCTYRNIRCNICSAWDTTGTLQISTGESGRNRLMWNHAHFDAILGIWIGWKKIWINEFMKLHDLKVRTPRLVGIHISFVWNKKDMFWNRHWITWSQINSYLKTTRKWEMILIMEWASFPSYHFKV